MTLEQKPAFVIGNGVSRKPIDLHKLRSRGIIYGCNALYRDFIPHYLIAADRKMIQEIQRAGYDKNHRCIFRKMRGDEFDGLVIAPGQVVNSGVQALYCAMKNGHRNIYLLGFDFATNNIYEGTKNYSKISRKKEFLRKEVFNTINKWNDRYSVNIVRVVDGNCYIPPNWTITDITVEKFLNELYK
jgi:hypothetical protein